MERTADDEVRQYAVGMGRCSDGTRVGGCAATLDGGKGLRGGVL